MTAATSSPRNCTPCPAGRTRVLQKSGHLPQKRPAELERHPTPTACLPAFPSAPRLPWPGHRPTWLACGDLSLPVLQAPGGGGAEPTLWGQDPASRAWAAGHPPPPTEYQLLKPRVGRWPCSCLRPQASLRGGGSLSLSQLALLCSDPHPPRAHTARGHQLTARLRLGQGASVCQWPRAVPRSPNTLRGWGGACARLAGHLCDSPSDGAAEAADTHYPIVGRLRRPQSCSS